MRLGFFRGRKLIQEITSDPATAAYTTTKEDIGKTISIKQIKEKKLK